MAQQTEIQNPFPQELPPRTQPAQGQRKSFRNCLTLRFLSSYSLRGISDKRTRWRRIGMLAVMFFLAGVAVVDWAFAFIYAPSFIGVIFVIVDVLFIWLLGWCYSLIGDAVGVRRVCGMNFGRTFFDYFILASFLLYVAVFLVGLFAAGALFDEILWVFASLIVSLVAVIANKPPIYPEGVV